jgi:GAF domain-containing protein
MRIFTKATVNSTDVNSIQYWRERIINTLLWILVVFGGIAYAANLFDLIRQDDWISIGFISIIYAWVLGITFIPKTSYSIRAYSLVVMAYMLSIFAYVVYALSGDGRIWIIFFALFTTVMLGWKAGLVTTILSILTHTIIGYLMLMEIVPQPDASSLLNSTISIGWITTGVILLLTTSILVAAIGVLLQGLENSLSNLTGSLQSEKDLTEELEKEQSELADRSENLERRLIQIRTAADISRIIVAELDPQQLMQTVVNTLKERFNLYYVGVFLVEERGRYAVLVSGSGEAGQRMMSAGHKLSVGGSSMIGWTVANKKPRIALDVGQEAIHFDNPYLPLTRSELALPLLRGDTALGALTVQSVEPEAFDDDDITVLQSIADILASAIENARLFQQIESTLEEISSLNRQFVQSAWQDVLSQSEEFHATAEALVADVPPNGLKALNIPLTLRGDHVIGNITLETGRQDWTEDELEFIDAVSSQAALALESARLLEESQRQVEQEAALNQITSLFARSMDFDTLLQTVVRELGQLPGIGEASIHITTPPTENDSTNGSPNAE